MNSNEAIKLLKKTAKQIDDLEKNHSFSKDHIKWVSDTLYLLEEVFGRRSRIFVTFAGLSWQFKGTFLATTDELEEERTKRDREAYLQDLGIARGLIGSGIDLIKRKGFDSVYEGKDTPKEASEILKIEYLIENNLRKAIRQKPTKESEVNDALETLFIGANLDRNFTREKEHIVYSSKTYKPDFMFKRISTIVESKLCDRAGREKEIIAEINDDIVAYKTAYSNLIFVVYDSGGVIRNADEFKGSIEKQESVVVKVIKH
jgi:hypothetical protein